MPGWFSQSSFWWFWLKSWSQVREVQERTKWTEILALKELPLGRRESNKQREGKMMIADRAEGTSETGQALASTRWTGWPGLKRYLSRWSAKPGSGRRNHRTTTLSAQAGHIWRPQRRLVWARRWCWDMDSGQLRWPRQRNHWWVLNRRTTRSGLSFQSSFLPPCEAARVPLGPSGGPPAGAGAEGEMEMGNRAGLIRYLFTWWSHQDLLQNCIQAGGR